MFIFKKDLIKKKQKNYKTSKNQKISTKHQKKNNKNEFWKSNTIKSINNHVFQQK